MNTHESPTKTVGTSVEFNDQAYFFTTSTFKLAVMSICTFGLYELYWFYKNWVFIKERTKPNIMPFWRAFFAPFWAYSCFKYIKNSARRNNVPESLSIGLFAIGYFVLRMSWKFPDPYWLITILSFAMLIPMNSVALSINKRLMPDFQNNETFSG